MSNYTKTTNFATKDNLSPGNPLKIVKGTEIDTEYNNIATAVATKTDNASAAITGGTITGITDLAVADGGTGASTAANARTNLGAAASGANSDITSITGLTTALTVAQGGTGVTTSTGTGNNVLSNSPTLVTPALGTPSALVGTNITGTASGLTAGNVTTNANLTGAVTSVGNATSLGSFTSANLASAVTDETGSGALVFANSPTLVTPALGTPSALVGTNITGTASGLTAGNVTTNANLTGAITSVGNATSLGSFSSANLSGALTDETGSGSAVFATSPTLVTPILGTPTSATLTNATGLPISTGVSGLGTGVATALAVNVGSSGAPLVNGGALGTPSGGTATNLTGLPLSTGVTGTLPVANGGTGQTSYTDGQLLIGNSTGNTLTKATLTAGTNVTITNSAGAITIAATGGGSGDVVGPASSTDNAFTRFDGTTGKLLQNSTGATLSDTGEAVFTGALDVLGNSTAGSNIKLYEDTDNGTNYVSFKAPDTIAANVTWTLPSADGSASQFLQTNGSGTLSWATGGGGSPGGSTTQVQYNNAGSFAGSSNMTFDGTRLTTAAITSSGVTNSFGSATNANVANLFSGTKTGYAMLAVDSSTLTIAATGDAGLIFIQPAVGNTIQKASTGTHANFASLYVAPFTVGAGASTLTNASSIYVPSAPSGATNNYAISVGSGTTYLNGLVNISGASGGQIQFPASQNASANANTLDDYEEGTWTPNSGGTATYTSQNGTYTKVGNKVTAHFSFQVNVIGTGSVNSILGLPFAASASAGSQSGHMSYATGLTSNQIFIGGYVPASGTTFFTTSSGAAASSVTTNNIIGNGTLLIGDITYFV